MISLPKNITVIDISHISKAFLTELLDYLKEKILKIQKFDEFDYIFSSNGFHFRDYSFYKVEESTLIASSIKYNLKYEITQKSESVLNNIPDYIVKIEMEVNRDSKNNIKVINLIFTDLSIPFMRL
jgi:hypothetical protein